MQTSPQPRLRVWLLLLIGGGVLLGLGVLLLGPLLVPTPNLRLFREDSQTPPSAQMPEAFTRQSERYGEREEVEKTDAERGTSGAGTRPPLAQLVSHTPPPDPAMAALLGEVRALRQGLTPSSPGPTTSPNDPVMVALLSEIRGLRQAQTTQAASLPGTPGTPAPPPATAKTTSWGYLAKGAASQESTKDGKEEKGDKNGPGLDIIQPANWAIPLSPLKTIYRSMRISARLLDNINSDIPADTIRIELTVPLMDKFHYNAIILDKGSVIIAQQQGKAEFGQARIPLKIEQIEFVTGEVVKVEGGVGDANGAAGIPGKVNAHTGQLLLATGINAVMNLGLGYAAGTPGAGIFYQDPAQKAAQEAGQSVARDVNEYTRQVLKRPPTIEVDATKKAVFVTVSLLKNVQFNRPPLVAR